MALSLMCRQYKTRHFYSFVKKLREVKKFNKVFHWGLTKYFSTVQRTTWHHTDCYFHHLILKFDSLAQCTLGPHAGWRVGYRYTVEAKSENVHNNNLTVQVPSRKRGGGLYVFCFPPKPTRCSPWGDYPSALWFLGW
jgi:hypothetical protein